MVYLHFYKFFIQTIHTINVTRVQLADKQADDQRIRRSIKQHQ